MVTQVVFDSSLKNSKFAFRLF